MGGVEPAGTHVLELLGSGRSVVTANKQLVARRGAELFAAASARRSAAPLRGVRVRGDPGDQGAPRVARRDERPPRARDRERDDELHAHRDGRRAARTTRRSRRRSGSATPRRTRRTTSAGVDAAAKIAILATVAFGSRVPLDWVDGRGDRVGVRGARRGRAGARHEREAARARDAPGRTRRRQGRPGVRRRPPPARCRRGRLQRGHAPGRRDPRDHARRPRRRRDRDGERSRGGHGLDRRDDRHRLPPGRPGVARPGADAARRARVAVVPPASRRRTAPACWPRSREKLAVEGVSVARLVQQPERRARCSTSSRTRRPRAASRPRSRRSQRCPSRAARRRALPGRVRARRGGARLGVTIPAAPNR